MNSRSILEVVGSLILGAVVVYSLAPSVLDFLRKWNNASWPSLDATIQRGRVGRGGPSKYAALVYRSVFEYGYSVGSNAYVGVFVLVLGSEVKSAFFQHRLKGARIKIRYNPQQPEISIVQSLPHEFADLVANQDPEWVNYDGGEMIDLNL